MPDEAGQAEEPYYLYRFFDGSGELLYVGISYSAPIRAYQHSRHSHWFPIARTMTIEVFPTPEDAELAEGLAIATEKPKFNTCKPSGRRTAGEYIIVHGERYASIAAALRAYKLFRNDLYQRMKRKNETIEQAIEALVRRDQIGEQRRQAEEQKLKAQLERRKYLEEIWREVDEEDALKIAAE
jgi:hypothetical protein